MTRTPTATTGTTTNPLGIHVFSDFDGTLSLGDTGTILIDYCVGEELRRQIDLEVFEGKRTFRSLCTYLWERVNLDWDKVIELLENVSLDEKAVDCLAFCREHGIPFTVLSCGVQSIIEWYIKRELQDHCADITIIANQASISKDGWRFFFHDESDHGHDKAASIRKAREAARARGDPFYAIFLGDGVSDLSAALEADLLLARRGKDLEAYCIRENISHEAFDTFQSTIDAIHRLKKSQSFSN
ncbi:HAD-like domain-containing protein [Syncephalis plumigaleata]|nr:HAD-like domain-containing protein [Syncephalis plumigaleata]